MCWPRLAEIGRDKIDRDPDDYGEHSADPEARMNGDGEDSDDVSSDEDIAGDATVPTLNYKGLPKRAAAQKCDEGMQRGGKRAATYRIRSSV